MKLKISTENKNYMISKTTEISKILKEQDNVELTHR